MQVAATKDLEEARASAAEQLQASQELVATLQAEQAEFEKRLQAAGNEADARGQQAQAELVRRFPGPPAYGSGFRDFGVCCANLICCQQYRAADQAYCYHQSRISVSGRNSYWKTFCCCRSETDAW